ncbi:MAG: heparan-alpha-glucosaminide N-acetyltransferase domain-containing protein [Promethearchaeota archaeon]
MTDKNFWKRSPLSRLTALDTLKGIAIVNIIIVHILYAGLEPGSRWFWGMYFWAMDFAGAPAFLFAAGISLAITVRKKEERYKVGTPLSGKIQSEVWFSSLFILALAIAFNVIGGFDEEGAACAWAWNVLQTIAISRLVSYYSLKSPKKGRVIMALFVVLISPFSLQFFSGQAETSVVGGIAWYVLYHPVYGDTLIPYLAYMVFGTVIGDVIFESYMRERDAHRSHDYHFHAAWNTRDARILIVKVGFFLIMASIWLGGLQPATTDLGTGMLKTLSTRPGADPPVIHSIFLRGSYTSVIFNLGMECVIFGFLLFISRQTSSRGLRSGTLSREAERRNFLATIGSMTLTIYLYHNAFGFLVHHVYTPSTIWLPAIGLILINIVPAYAWARWGRGRGSVEWAIKKLRHHAIVSRREVGKAAQGLAFTGAALPSP